MKKTFLVIICIVVIIVAAIWIKYLSYKQEQNEIKEENKVYEAYLNNESTGRDLTTIIDKAIDSNEKNEVEKDEQGFYISNDTNSIKIELKMADDEGNIYQMESIYNGGMEIFLSYYGDITFNCTTIEYNSLGKVKYMLFEQIAN